MHGGEEKNEGRVTVVKVRKEKRKFVGEVERWWTSKWRRYGHLYLFIPSIDRSKSE